MSVVDRRLEEFGLSGAGPVLVTYRCEDCGELLAETRRGPKGTPLVYMRGERQGTGTKAVFVYEVDSARREVLAERAGVEPARTVFCVEHGSSLGSGLTHSTILGDYEEAKSSRPITRTVKVGNRNPALP